MNTSEVLDALIFTQWALARMDIESPEFDKMADARNLISDSIVSYIQRLEQQCKNTLEK